MQVSKPFAEIIESSLSSWRAQCWQWDTIPAFGSLVTIKRRSAPFLGWCTKFKQVPPIADEQYLPIRKQKMN